MMMQLKKQRGIGLLELMLSLAIIAILLIMATRYYQTAHMGQRVNDGISMVEAIRGAAAHWEAGKPSYQGVSMQALTDYGLIPKDVVGNQSNPGQGTNPWGGNVSITTANGAGSQITITLTNVPREACLNMQGKLSNQAISVTQSCQTVGTFSATF